MFISKIAPGLQIEQMPKQQLTIFIIVEGCRLFSDIIKCAL